MKGVYFIPFPKPKTQLERCKDWIKRCNRPQQQLSVEKIKAHHYVCSKVSVKLTVLYIMLHNVILVEGS